MGHTQPKIVYDLRPGQFTGTVSVAAIATVVTGSRVARYSAGIWADVYFPGSVVALGPHTLPCQGLFLHHGHIVSL